MVNLVETGGVGSGRRGATCSQNQWNKLVINAFNLFLKYYVICILTTDLQTMDYALP